MLGFLAKNPTGLKRLNHQRTHWLGIVLIILVCVPVSAAVNNAPLKNKIPGLAGNVVKKVLPNGLTVLIKPTQANQVVAVDLFLKMGPFYEERKERGLSSLTQRVLVRGTSTRSAQDIVMATESSGSSIDAGVSGEYGTVSLSTTLTGWEETLEVLLDIILHPSFSQSEVEREKELMIEELASREDQPFNSAYLTFIQAYFDGNPYGINGKELMDNVATLTRSDLISWYRKFYVPNNMVISVVGNVEPQKIICLIEENLAGMTSGRIPEMVKINFPNKSENVLKYKQKNTQALFMVLGYPAPEMNSKDAPVMELISRILGEGESRLYRELREKRGLAYTVFSGYQSSKGSSYMYSFIATSPTQFEAVRSGILMEYEKLCEEWVSQQELSDAKKGLTGSYLMSLETNAAQSNILGKYELMGLGYAYNGYYLKRIKQVTATDIRRVARKYFKNYVIGVVSPVEIK